MSLDSALITADLPRPADESGATGSYQPVIDALSAHIALCDADGVIVAVNEAWCTFADDNSGSMGAYGVGLNYLTLLDGIAWGVQDRRLQLSEDRHYEADIAGRTAAGLRSVLAHAIPKFQLEYRCDAPHEQRWFLLTVTPFPGMGPICAVVSHENVTPVKRAEAHAVHQSAKLVEAFNGAVDAIALLVETRDPYTAGHQHRVAGFADTIAASLGVEDDQRTGLRLGSTLHDIGKISIPAEILVRPGRLSALETQMIRLHPRTGFEVLNRVSFPWPIADMVAQHHERLDGSGYPYGLVGEQICLEARIIAVADVFDAMSSHRPYRPAVSLDESVAALLAGRGIGLDADSVDALLLHLSAQPLTPARPLTPAP